MQNTIFKIEITLIILFQSNYLEAIQIGGGTSYQMKEQNRFNCKE